MSDKKRWDGLAYQRMQSVEYGAGRLSVRFEDGSTAALEASRALPQGVESPKWQQLDFDEYEIRVPARTGAVEIPWSTIRELTDPGYAAHLADTATEQARLIGLRIQTLRAERGLSAEQLAKQAGQPVDFLRGIERGEDTSDLATLQGIMKAMGCSLADLIVDDGRSAPADG